jgi:hypothetical protein
MAIFHDAKPMLSGKYKSGITDGLLLGKAVSLLYIQNRLSIHKGEADQEDTSSDKNKLSKEGTTTSRA